MLILNRKIAHPVDTSIHLDGELCLPFLIRQKSRFRACLVDGADVGVEVERGTILRGGEWLTGPENKTIKVIAQAEKVSTVFHEDPHGLARAAYHLGNRHVPLQIGDHWLRYLHDHVLDDMCLQLGLRVTIEEAAFEPEHGAYGGHAHHHQHD